jgi:hypothetical protein
MQLGNRVLKKKQKVKIQLIPEQQTPHLTVMTQSQQSPSQDLIPADYSTHLQ